MKKCIVIPALLLLSLPYQALASSIIQDYATGPHNINVSGEGTRGIGQTFLATATSFTSISVHISPYPESSSSPYTGPNDLSILFELYEGMPVAGSMSTAQWIQKEIDLSSLDTPGGGTLNVDISFLDFTIGSGYTFTLLNDTSYWNTSLASNGYDYYDQGSLFYIDNNAYSSTTVNADLKFSVNTPTPEPSSILLLASGLSILTAFRKKFLTIQEHP